MTPSAPQRSTIGTGDWTRKPTMVLRQAGQLLIGPIEVVDQSKARIRPANSPLSAMKSAALGSSLGAGTDCFLVGPSLEGDGSEEG
jgi:hypothetical protein